jgi:hypothetical protein
LGSFHGASVFLFTGLVLITVEAATLGVNEVTS